MKRKDHFEGRVTSVAKELFVLGQCSIAHVYYVGPSNRPTKFLSICTSIELFNQFSLLFHNLAAIVKFYFMQFLDLFEYKTILFIQ